MRFLLTLLLITSAFLFSGCTKEQGCTNPEACNFSQSAEEDDGSCYLPGDECDDGNDFTTLDQYTNTCQCEGVNIGCSNISACNYDASVNTDDGSCYFEGDSCDDGNGATINDTWSSSCSCSGELLGCTFSSACNYNSDADLDDGSCYFVGDSCDDGNSATGNDTWNNNCYCEGDICGSDVYHEGYTYSTVQIGDQCWFSENCRYLPEVSPSSESNDTAPYYYVYGFNGTNVASAKATSYYEIYGVLYNWPAVMTEGICPSGWHIPSDGEFTQLANFLGGESVAGYAMKSTSGWNSNGNGSNSSGFNGLPGGQRTTQGFGYYGIQGCWWSASSASGFDSWANNLHGNFNDVLRFDYQRNIGFSARCVRD